MRVSAHFVRLLSQSYVAPVLLPPESARLFLPPAQTWHEEKRLEMMKLMRQLLVIAMLGVVSAGAFAQRKGQDKRPPKEPAKVITNDQKNQRPPKNNDRPPKQGNRNRPD